VSEARIDPLEAGSPVASSPAVAPEAVGSAEPRTAEASRARSVRGVSRLKASIVGAAIVVGLAALLVLGRSWTVDDLVPILVGVGGVCLALLARGIAPGLAWVALILASLVASGVPIGLSRAADPGAIGVVRWLTIALPSSAAAILTVVIAALYATRSERRLTTRVGTLAAFLVAWLVVACVLVVILVIAGARADPAFTVVDVATTPTALFLHFVLLLAALGVAGDLRAAMIRAEDASIRAGPSSPAGQQPLADRVRGILRELIPGQVEADAATIEAERVRLAGDLHASVLPSLRRAIAEAEAGMPIENLAQRLKTVDLELERLMADRWPVVLEAFGLLAALEDLAERTEAESPIHVVLEIGLVGGRPRPEIERTAWRIAQVALDNAVRHAAASQVAIGIAYATDRVWLLIADDGRGFDPTDPIRTGARGLADLARRAAAIGGSVAVEAGKPTGTVVRFDWPAPGESPGSGPRRA
jgi:signal transduction histidine kinase